MPVEIRELVIRVTTSGDPREEAQPQARQEPINVDLIVRECVRQVLNILKKKEER